MQDSTALLPYYLLGSGVPYKYLPLANHLAKCNKLSTTVLPRQRQNKFHKWPLRIDGLMR